MSRVLVLGGYAPTLFLFRAPLLKALVEAGHEVIASAPDEDPRVPSAMSALGVQWKPIEFERNRVQPVRDLFFLGRIRALLREIQPDRLLCYAIKPNIYGGWAARAEDIPSAAMVTGLGTVFGSSGPRRLIASRMLRRACRHHDRIFFQNHDDREDLIKTGVVEDPDKAIVTAGSGIDLDDFTVKPLPDRPIFLMLSRLLAAKGVREYLRAAAIVKSACPDAVMRLGGMEDPGSGGVPMHEIQDAVDSGSVDYLGHIEDVHAAFAACSVGVLPSWYGEGVPHSLLEAMATGRPIITTDSRGCRETVTPSSNGTLVPPGNAEALADAMIDLARDPSRRAAMGIESRQLAEDRFDARVVARQIMDALSL